MGVKASMGGQAEGGTGNEAFSRGFAECKKCASSREAVCVKGTPGKAMNGSRETHTRSITRSGKIHNTRGRKTKRCKIKIEKQFKGGGGERKNHRRPLY